MLDVELGRQIAQKYDAKVSSVNEVEEFNAKSNLLRAEEEEKSWTEKLATTLVPDMVSPGQEKTINPMVEETRKLSSINQLEKTRADIQHRNDVVSEKQQPPPIIVSSNVSSPTNINNSQQIQQKVYRPASNPSQMFSTT